MARAPSDITQWSPGNSYVRQVMRRLGAHTIPVFRAVWFKVAESGKTSDGKWAATDGLYANNHIYTFTTPARLRPGQYIIRHEMYVSIFSVARAFTHSDNKALLSTLVSHDRVQGLAGIHPSESPCERSMVLPWSSSM